MDIVPDLSVVIVSWNVCALLRHCLRSIVLKTPHWPMCQVIVVDCASTDNSVAMVRHEFPEVQLIVSPQNLGYARGANLGIAHASGRYLMIMNPDTEVVGDALAVLVDYLDVHPQVGAAGPQLRYADGRAQPSRRRFPTLATAFWESTILQQWFPRNRFARYYYMEDRAPDSAQPVDWLVGAALIIRRAAWEAVGPLDEGYFMYFEELDWCRRCRAAGWEVHYVPQAVVIHHEAQSSSQVPVARTLHFQRSKVRYFHKYHGAAWANLIRFFLLCTFAIQLLEEALKWLLGHKRPLRRERIYAYWQVLRSRLLEDAR
ncbi:MAG: glycosyltransferase family 2 protein [Anaerolineae bacterium]|nr:glycosyltransferase family 2 protein [Anaerolineae bacterium]MDW8071018.1 glycosyltransferase family 2 protein [Anaerolineae bacterium]